MRRKVKIINKYKVRSFMEKYTIAIVIGAVFFFILSIMEFSVGRRVFKELL